MFKNVINSKRKRDVINVRVFSILILACGLDSICGQRHCGLFFNRNLGLRLRENPKTTGFPVNTTTGDPLLLALYSIIETEPPNTTTARTRRPRITKYSQKKPLKTKSVTLRVPRPTLVRWKYIKTQWVTVPKRKWYKYNASLTTPYDIDARRREKRREHRMKLKEQARLRIERRKIPTSERPKVVRDTFQVFADPFYSYMRKTTISTTLSTSNDSSTSTTPSTTTKSLRQIKAEKLARIMEKKKEVELRKAKKEAAREAREKARAEGKLVPEPEESTTFKYTRPRIVTVGTTKDIWLRMAEKKKGGKIGGLKRKIYHDDPANKQKYMRDKQMARDKKKNKNRGKKAPVQKKGKGGVVDKS